MTSFLRSVAYVLRLLGQTVAYARSSRRAGLVVVVLATPVVLLVAAVAGITSPFVVYPFI